MKRILLAVAIGLSTGLPVSFAQAQTRVIERQAALASERGMQISDATRRLTAAIQRTLGDPAIASPASPHTLAAAIDGKAQAITDSRAELVGIGDELSGLSPIAREGDADVLRSIDRNTTATAELARRADRILGDLQALPEAVRTGDQARFDAAYRSVMAGMILLHEAQGLSLRGQADLQDSDMPQSAQFSAMACFSDGQAAMQSGMSGLRPRDVALEQLDAAETCMRDDVARGIDLMGAYENADATAARLAPLQRSLFGIILEGADWLNGVRDALARGENPGVISRTFNPAYVGIVTRIQDNTMRQNQIVADDL